VLKRTVRFATGYTVNSQQETLKWTIIEAAAVVGSTYGDSEHYRAEGCADTLRTCLILLQPYLQAVYRLFRDVRVHDVDKCGDRTKI
jgi:hypothetical protein